MQTVGAGAALPGTIKLPQPLVTGGKSLTEAIAQRHSTREYSLIPLSLEDLSGVLWAAFGLTREYAGTGIHTKGCHAAPAAHNWQEIDVYVALETGLYLYDAADHQLLGVLAEDVRRFTAHDEQPFVLDVPVILIYVAHLARMDDASDWDRSVFPWADSGVIAENVYLYCAAADLATVVRALFDRPALSEAMRLRSDQLVTFSQPVGYAL